MRIGVMHDQVPDGTIDGACIALVSRNGTTELESRRSHTVIRKRLATSISKAVWAGDRAPTFLPTARGSSKNLVRRDSGSLKGSRRQTKDKNIIQRGIEQQAQRSSYPGSLRTFGKVFEGLRSWMTQAISTRHWSLAFVRTRS
jgi:hypothetical protein